MSPLLAGTVGHGRFDGRGNIELPRPERVVRRR